MEVPIPHHTKNICGIEQKKSWPQNGTLWYPEHNKWRRTVTFALNRLLTVVELQLKPVKNGALNSIGCLKAPEQRGVVNCIERCG